MPSINQISTVRVPDRGAHDASASKRRRPIFWPFVLAFSALVAYGLVVVFSAVSADADYSFSRQLGGVAVGLVVMAVVWHFDYTRLAGYQNIFLIINVVLILSPHLPVIGVNTMGATSWINIGMQVQPGEFAKITVILFDAAVMAKYQGALNDVREYLRTVGLMLVPFACIMTQPDLGTGLVYLFIGATALVAGGANRRFLIASLLVGIALVALVFSVDEVIKNATGDYKLLKQYQRNRLLVFMNQGSTNLSEEGYNLNQAMIAIGSGGLFGQGYMQGSQHGLGILPEAPTDFVFCVLAEEFGFAGAMLLLVLYIGLLASCFYIATRAGDVFGVLIVMSVVGMWLFQILENIGMTCGLMPITGIPLPFVSYGSSFMVVNFAMLGFVGSVWAHNKQNARRAGYAATR